MADDAKKKARQKAFYHKQRLDAEAKVKAGGLGAGKDADTLQSIGSKLAKSKDKGAQDTAKKDLGISARYRAGVRQGPLDPNPSAAADLAGTAASFLPAGKYAGKGIKALERWGEGAARSGMKNSGKAEKAAADVSKAASKTRTPAQQAQKAADEKAGNKIVNGGPKKKSGKLEGPPPTPMPRTDGNKKVTASKETPELADRGVKNNKYREQPAPKASAAPAPKASAAPKADKAPASGGSATDAYKAAKGKEARSAAWKAMSKDEQKAYQSARGPSTTNGTKPKGKQSIYPKNSLEYKADPESPGFDGGGSAPKAKTPKPPKGGAPAAKDPNDMSDSELEAYKKTAPKDAKGRTILKSPDSAPPVAADAPSTAGKGYVKQKIAAMKAQKAQAAADAAKDAGSATP
jgi:hypothetical protein